MVYSGYIKQRILFYHHSGKTLQQVMRRLAEERHVATKAGVAKLLRCYNETGMIARAPVSGQKSKMTAVMKQIVEEQMEKNFETTGKKLQKLFGEKGVVRDTFALKERDNYHNRLQAFTRGLTEHLFREH